MANPGDLQFDRAEPAAAGAAPTRCTVCQQPLAGSYYAVNGRAVCASCRDKVAAHAESGHFATAFLLGLGAAALGAGIYFGIEALTGYEFGISLRSSSGCWWATRSGRDRAELGAGATRRSPSA